MRILAALLCCLLLASCVTLGPGKPASPPSKPPKAGPPPHAPAHGYRHRQADGSELQFDSDLGVYVVVGLPDCWFADGLYLRLQGGAWEASVDLKAGWKPADEGKVPSKLKGRKGKHPGRGRNK